MNAIVVALSADDPITGDGALARLARYPQIRLASPRERPDVLLVIAGEVTDAVVESMRRASSGDQGLAVVLVANGIGREQLHRAVRAGLVGLLPRRRVDFDRVVETVVAAGTGRARLPDAAQRCLLDQLSAAHRDGLADASSSALSPREVRVLRLLADGIDTHGVATQLNYSERTVKNIIHGVVLREKLRNRTHAVAYALRMGAL